MYHDTALTKRLKDAMPRASKAYREAVGHVIEAGTRPGPARDEALENLQQLLPDWANINVNSGKDRAVECAHAAILLATA